jgi:ubiquinone/menaquinone biosynthesis C-methylase UbiE
MEENVRIKLFDQWSKNYDQTIQSPGEFPFDGYEQVLDTIVRFADPIPGIRILDLGTGTGNLAERFITKGYQVWALDFSEEMLSKAKSKLPEVHLIRCNLMDEFPKELPHDCDRIVSAYIFHEFELSKKLL